MKRIVLPNDMTRWDQSRIESGISSRDLMERAARGLLESVKKMRIGTEIVTCVCGSGNNGGDGIALANLLNREHIPVRIILAGNQDRMTEESAYYLELAISQNIPVTPIWHPEDGEILVDALFGIGLNRPVDGKYAELICSMNNSGKRILSADIPSGLDARTGDVLGISICAEETVTMQYLKSGLFLGKGPGKTGRLTVCSLDRESPFDYSADLFLQEVSDIECLFDPRPFDSHKGKNGHALLCVGSNRYVGAALLSSKAALRAGCGILSVCLPDPIRSVFSALPEAITVPVGSSDWDDCACKNAVSALAGKSAVGIGCGIASGDVSPLLRAVFSSGLPTVLDADGLNCLSRNRDLIPMLHKNVVITPHPGEMARLLDCTVNEVLSDPLSCVKAFPCVTLLKGPTTLVSDGCMTWFCTEGTPALAKGGSGDVLTGIITGLLSQGFSPMNAARAGTYLLGTSARKAMTLLGERMLLASDVIDAITML